ncbi:MAG: hypothetical protein IT383_07030 [Deltaproteobacteria bacterium]|nr:hypothetical protein [Deltaproteobacteria bacterium]
MARRASWLLACGSSALLLIAAACQTPARVTASAAASSETPWISAHLERAQQSLGAFGLVLGPGATTVVVHDTTASFVAATGHDEPALRAWTTWSTVHLLHPRLWGDDSDAVRTKRLTHELCHAALLHAFADEQAARTAELPRFFTEGACSVVAGQARVSLDKVLARADDDLPLTIDWFVKDPDVAYGAAHALATALVHEHGPGVFAQVMASAARDGRAGCVERAALTLAGAPDVPAWWRRVVDSAGRAP